MQKPTHVVGASEFLLDCYSHPALNSIEVVLVIGIVNGF